MSDTSWVELCSLEEVPVQGGKYVTVGNRSLAVFRLNDSGVGDSEVFVLDDTCPHAGGSLSAGMIDNATGCVICPWHGWPFALEDGRCPDNSAIGVKKYPVRMFDGQVQVQMQMKKNTNGEI